MFGITDDILVVGYDDNDRDHDNMLRRVLQICREINPKLNKDKIHFSCSLFHFGKVIFRHGLKPDPKKLKTFMEMPMGHKNEFVSIPWNNYLPEKMI